MRPAVCFPGMMRPVCFLVAGLLLAAFPPIKAPADDEGSKRRADVAEKKEVRTAPELPEVEVRFTDGGNLKLVVKDQWVTLTTPYGKLRIPATDIRRIEFATRLAADTAKRLETAVADLGNSEYRVREAASVELKKLREKAYPALLKAAAQKDPEVARRAETLLTQLRETVPEDLLVVRKDDVVYTPDSKLAGRIEAATLKLHSRQFGDVEAKLVDMHSLRSLLAESEESERRRELVGKHVEVQQGARWWPAEIVEAKGASYRIHYSGWDASFDEWVTKERIRFLDKKDTFRTENSARP
jgi:RNA binding activity-knot of a chromodomain